MTTAKADRLAALPGYDASAPILRVEDLKVEFAARHIRARVIDGVSYHVSAGETLAVIGESGCGKSITARTIMGILPPNGRVTGGSVRLHGVDTLSLAPKIKRQIRGRRIAMIFQDSPAALNPVLPIGYQIAEIFRTHQGASRAESNHRAIEMLDRVRIPDAARRAKEFPHQFSGGMRQRAMIAMALSLDPDVLIADEPTTALDVTVQAQIMELLSELTTERRMALILITHDLGVVADMADRVVVMYAGRVVEQAPAASIYAAPQHPYTRALLDAIPRRALRGKPLSIVQGSPPDLTRPIYGCPFRPRCAEADEACAVAPPLLPVGGDALVACHRRREVPDE